MKGAYKGILQDTCQTFNSSYFTAERHGFFILLYYWILFTSTYIFYLKKKKKETVHRVQKVQLKKMTDKQSAHRSKDSR